MLSYINKFF